MVLNRFEKRGLIWGQARTELEVQLAQLKVAGQVHQKCVLLEPPIRNNVHVAESSSEHKPVVIHAPDSIGGEDFSLLTQNFINHFEKNL